MSDDSDELRAPPGRRIRKVTVVSSTSDSDSDGDIGTSTRRKRMRVVSDDSDSSGSSAVRARPLPRQRVSPVVGAAEGSLLHSQKVPSARSASGFTSDSSEGDSDKCSICLMKFIDQEIGTPQTCDHIFCLDCITEWSRNVNTCPVDRSTFYFIVVREYVGGVIVRTEPVNMLPRLPSLEDTMGLDLTRCEICGQADNEDTMLLCDGCDLGFHMQCLSNPLDEVPLGEWHCPNCVNGFRGARIPDAEEISDGEDGNLSFGPLPLFASQINISTHIEYFRNLTEALEGLERGSNGSGSVPSSSRQSSLTVGSHSRNSSRRRTTARYAPHRRKYKRRRNKTVIVEYENGERPVAKKRKIKKRAVQNRRSRTAARRTHVRESVRAQLAVLKAGDRQALVEASTAGSGVQDLSVRRQRAGIPSLSLLGNPNQLEYFSDEEHDVSEGASTAVAVRPTSSTLNAYRQARRKMITIPSPPHASSAPDILSSILESQTLLHSKKSVISISVDGNVNIKLEPYPPSAARQPAGDKQALGGGRVDLSKGAEGAKQTPAYPGQSRTGGGWGGGYRGNYHREQGATGFGRGSYNEGNYPGGPRHGSRFGQNEPPRRNQPADSFADYTRRPHRYPPPPPDDAHADRNRRHSDTARHDVQPPWRPYGAASVPRQAAPPFDRHSFGGFDDPLDMRTGHPTPRAPPPCRPLPDPPVFGFNVASDLDKSEDERSDPDLVIDTDKYDPTEPTHDDDSADEDGTQSAPAPLQPLPPPPAPPALPQADALRGALAGLDVSVSVPPAVLDDAVRQVLHEHRDLLAAAPLPAGADASDDDSDGDCPNFSIYSATSVHIANNTSVLATEEPKVALPRDDLEDLVQEDDDGPEPAHPPPPSAAPALGTGEAAKPPPASRHYSFDINAKKKSEEYKEKVSKRCPITANTRNPIKIKLNTPSLIKRPVSLYDEDEEALGADAAESEAPPPQPQQAATGISAANVPTESHEQRKLEADVKPTETCKTPEIVAAHNNDSSATSDLDDGGSHDSDKLRSAAEQRPGDGAPAATAPGGGAADQCDPQRELEQLNGCIETAEEKSDHGDCSDNASELNELARLDAVSPPAQPASAPAGSNGALPDKMTESISETEDERSYTPCLDENKSKDTSLEAEKDKGIEGLDTEMISEDEGNEMFSDEDRARFGRSHTSPAPPASAAATEEEPPAAKKEAKPDSEPKKKKKKESKKETKERGKTKRKGDVAFRKISKSGKGRNYRERDKEAAERERRGSTASADRDKRKRTRKEKRKDLERYDVRTVVVEKRRKRKDPFGRDVSPRARSRSPSLSPPRRSVSPVLRRRSPSPVTRRRSSTSRGRSPSRVRRSLTPVRQSPAVARASPAPGGRRRRSSSPVRPSPSPARGRRSPSPRSSSARAASPRRRVRRTEPRPEVRRRRTAERTRKRRRSASGSKSPRPKTTKRKKRACSERATSRRRKSPRRRRARRRSGSRVPGHSPAGGRPPSAAPGEWSPATVESRPPSPCTPPPAPEPAEAPRRRRDAERTRHRRARDAAGASKEVFTSGDNILVSVSFKEQERGDGDDRRTRRRERRRRRRRAAAPEQEAAAAVRPVAIIDLERSPFRELTPSPRDVIVLSDSEGADREPSETPAPQPQPPPQQQQQQQPANGNSAAPAAGVVEPAQPQASEERGPTTPPDPPDSPDAYDPYEPTRSASGSPSPSPSPAPAGSPPRTAMTLEAAQKTNMSADDVIDRRPLSPIEKVMALLQSTREVSPEPPPQEPSPAETPSVAVAPSPAGPPAGAGVGPGAGPVVAPPVRIVLPEPSRTQAPKLFLAKPSPIKSDPIKPMPKPVRQAPADSPYSPGSSDFGDLFSPPPLGAARRDPFDALVDRPPRRSARSSGRSAAARVPVRLDRNQGGRTQVGIKIDQDNLKILDDLPSSAVEMQVKSKFLKKLNRQERVVEEVKLVLKPHYNKKHVTKDEYKDILRRAVPKICHNKSGEINPTKIQALVEAYVKKIRKKHKLGLL